MQAMILAAGLGTRLKPLTDDTPKALINVYGRTLLEIAIRNLIEYGFNKIIINVHHHADKIKQFIEANTFAADIFISDETELLLDTGGGIKNALHFFDNLPVLIHNVDIISNLDLNEFYNYHLSDDSLASLVVSKRVSSRYLLFNEDNILCGWEDIKKNERIIVRDEPDYKQLAFNGIHIINPELIKKFPEDKVFSVIKAYLMAARTEEINAYLCNDIKWIDVGKIDSLQRAEELVKKIF
ncbi:MAG: nucleotidyltransferase family protein [Ignavibacteriota bacterium]|jgi:NDP-sugar pyrophosphorylase family protein|nr:MAG: nucleotidyltransferase family protein [Ignavibacterium sp.]MBL1154485.1 nucleotidyltransferase family protein [Ignavibacteriota bacterium]MCO6448731.1 nucleotidyltransferase family protein [Ignavibacterium album]MCZ2269968.1 nucleotidyltransferase family protein [Ignavibacteriales bacterium]MDX9712609.1 nucleotidyltransferase family protein [Ignavibacteriaceae bacterium]